MGRPRKKLAPVLDTEIEEVKEEEKKEGVSINRMIGKSKPEIIYSFNQHFNI